MFAVFVTYGAVIMILFYTAGLIQLFWVLWAVYLTYAFSSRAHLDGSLEFQPFRDVRGPNPPCRHAEREFHSQLSRSGGTGRT